jgi:hypothetical protein
MKFFIVRKIAAQYSTKYTFRRHITLFSSKVSEFLNIL